MFLIVYERRVIVSAKSETYAFKIFNISKRLFFLAERCKFNIKILSVAASVRRGPQRLGACVHVVGIFLWFTLQNVSFPLFIPSMSAILKSSISESAAKLPPT